jgi:predicted transcriptional regulator
MVETKLVRDLMIVGVPTCKRDTPVVEIARFLMDRNLEGICVLDEEGNGVGLVGVEELVNAYGRQEIWELVAEDVMREGMPTLPADITIKLAAEFMQDQNTRIAFLIHNAAGTIYPAAYITFRHLVRHLAAESDEELKDLGIRAQRELPVEAFIKRRDAAKKRNLSNNS